MPLNRTLPDTFVTRTRDQRNYAQHQRATRRGGKPNALQELPTTNALGARLRELRKQAGLDQKQTGELIGYGKHGCGRVSDYELGHRVPSLHLLYRYALAFNMTVSQLLDGVI